mmetsp:Transcript_16537/g.20585  ORF Transcript_16537/g.20585 Transcript_16537/m.20585 type:complete len:177 (+) Transcript_16537:59-589(+)|eukprot:CAMPEP_0172505328 /NCGR_PEP_ID=MMETSP1066-20121228/185528_1 /TAXON_ID=671091 /ORGANISM="Coscinodiscus wailesii, Strain CCMP2513" /LENGTH=176 /DNA_ID=CAMNT_0013281897 /DNA_START=59 /DNA_END=589 /DNA_ORIENTATION=+
MVQLSSLSIPVSFLIVSIVIRSIYSFDESQYDADLIAEEKAIFTKFDKNNDGFLNKEEVREWVLSDYVDALESEIYDSQERMDLLDGLGFEQSAVTDADTNGDGQLSKEETLVAIGHYIDDVELVEIFEDQDKDDDGSLSWEEFFEPYDLGDFGGFGDDFSFDEDEDDGDDLGDEF